MKPQIDRQPRLHHVGYVVSDIEKSAAGFVDSVGACWDGIIVADPLQGARVSFLTLRPEDAQIELVEPDASGAPTARFLTEKGGGLHHLCYEVKDLNVALEEMRAAGNLLAKPPKPAAAFGGRRIAWLLTPEKLLLELLELQAD
ncbi:MAG TPA: VOC family protein [Candidatus Acidoferrales bacterium]|jgi:methylmalonyl-CoA/ethylmalonyl-CoA epimerase